MKIVEKEKKDYYFEPDKYCCRKMKKYLGRCMIIWLSNGIVCIGDSYKDNTDISYCPFCGEKIITNTKDSLI